MVRATSLAFGDRDRYLTDSDQMAVATNTLLEASYLAERVERLSVARRAEPLTVSAAKGNTTSAAPSTPRATPREVARGHDVVSLVEAHSQLVGHAQAIRIFADRANPADPRSDGVALGF